MNDLSKFHIGMPGSYANAPETSAEAAASVADAAITRRAAVHAFIGSRGRYGATADEVAASLEWERYSSRPRVAELNKARAIVDSGERREGVSGRRQAVWVLPCFGPDTPSDGQGDLFGGSCV